MCGLHAAPWQKGKVAGGSPAAGNFLLLGQKKVTKEKAAPANRRSRGALRCSAWTAAAELASVIKR
jgi:hypothetical protein